MDIKNDLLTMLIDNYERSGHAMPNKTSNRGVYVSTKKLKWYKENSYEDVRNLSSAVSEMEQKGYIYSSPKKNCNQKLIDKVFLNLDMVETVYLYMNRKPIVDQAHKISEILQKSIPCVNFPWMKQFISSEISNLKLNLKTSKYLSMDLKYVEDICKVLIYMDGNPVLMRVASVRCFNNSKYIEQHLKSSLVSIAKKYEPDIVLYNSYEDNRLTERQILEQIGLIIYPEIFEFCGLFSAHIADSEVDFSPFTQGYCLQSEMVKYIHHFNLNGIKKIILVENRTNYRQMVLNIIECDTIVIHHGGFYSPLKGLFFKLLFDSANPEILFNFWGDIDLGGFLMFDRLKRIIIPSLEPMKMDRITLENSKEFGLKHTEDYFAKLACYKNDTFKDVIDYIIEEKFTLEQECLL